MRGTLIALYSTGALHGKKANHFRIVSRLVRGRKKEKRFLSSDYGALAGS